MEKKCKVIAEAGVNHNGDFSMAVDMIFAANESGADVIKFQTISAETNYNFAIEDTSVYPFVRDAAFSESQHQELMDICQNLPIEFMSSAADLPAAKMLNSLGMNCFKISSGNFTNFHLLDFIAGLKKPMIVSTGMASPDEISTTHDFLISRGITDDLITFLYCVSEYPAQFSNIDFSRMDSLKKRFPHTSFGFSDHTPGITSSILARSLGASVIEKHFTLDRKLPGPDQIFSLEPIDLKSLVIELKNTDQIMFADKKLNNGEHENKPKLRRSMYANQFISRGTIITTDMIAAKRPYNPNGISPMDFKSIVGSVADKDIDANELISISEKT